MVSHDFEMLVVKVCGTGNDLAERALRDASRGLPEAALTRIAASYTRNKSRIRQSHVGWAINACKDEREKVAS